MPDSSVVPVTLGNEDHKSGQPGRCKETMSESEKIRTGVQLSRRGPACLACPHILHSIPSLPKGATKNQKLEISEVQCHIKVALWCFHCLTKQVLLKVKLP